MTYWCSECDVFFWPYMAKRFGGACPTCGSGTKARQEPGSPEAMELYAAALAVKAEEDAKRARRMEWEEYYAAHCHNEAIKFEADVQHDLARLPVLGEEAA